MTIPWEAMDAEHPDHDGWVAVAGRCFADHDHFIHSPACRAQVLAECPDIYYCTHTHQCICQGKRSR